MTFQDEFLQVYGVFLKHSDDGIVRFPLSHPLPMPITDKVIRKMPHKGYYFDYRDNRPTLVIF